jgi:hypothetical protein
MPLKILWVFMIISNQEETKVYQLPNIFQSKVRIRAMLNNIWVESAFTFPSKIKIMFWFKNNFMHIFFKFGFV